MAKDTGFSLFSQPWVIAPYTMGNRPATHGIQMTALRTGLQWAGLTLLLATGPTLGDSVYRCEQGGQVVFSDQPCDEDARPERIRPHSRGLQFGSGSGGRSDEPENDAPNAGADEQTEDTNASPCRDFTSTERRRLRVRGELVPGMTREDVRESLGRPAEQHQEPRELWIYVQRSRGYPVGETRIYFRDGCVERIQ